MKAMTPLYLFLESCNKKHRSISLHGPCLPLPNKGGRGERYVAHVFLLCLSVPDGIPTLYDSHPGRLTGGVGTAQDTMTEVSSCAPERPRGILVAFK